MPAGVSSDLADRVAELGMLLGFLSSTDALADAHLVGLDAELQLGLLSRLKLLSSADDWAEANLLGLEQAPEGTASEP